MTNAGRYLLALEKDGFAIILEFPGQQTLDDYLAEVEPKNLKTTQIDLMRYLTDYRGHRYFDFRNPDTLRGFDLDFILKSWAMDKEHHPAEGTDEWFIH